MNTRATGHRALVFALTLMVGSVTGCQSIWESITSPSDSISGTVNSISGSFEAMIEGISQSCSGKKPSDHAMAYGDDVRVFTRAFVGSERSADAFLVDLAQVSEQHGIVDYEGELMTFHAVGIGLGEAGLDADAVDAFLTGVQLTSGVVHVHEGHRQTL